MNYQDECKRKEGEMGKAMNYFPVEGSACASSNIAACCTCM
jgi:hypothetical protein